MASSTFLLKASLIVFVTNKNKGKQAVVPDEPLPENWEAQCKVYDDADKFFNDKK